MHQKPKTQIKKGRYLDKPDEKYNHKKSEDASARIENEISSQNSGDGARGADHGQLTMRAHIKLGRRRANAHQQIINQVSNMSQVVFHVVAKNIEKPRVPQNVSPTAVQKHRIKNIGD